MKWHLIFLVCIYLVNFGFSSSENRVNYGEIRLFQTPVSYNVDMTVLLNDASRREKEVSYKVKAALNVYPVWIDSEFECLLKFELVSPQLQSRGKHVSAEYMPMKSVWDAYSHSTFYAHWKNGLVQTAYLDPNELIDIQNFKRSLISLFQIQAFNGEHREIDISGTCDVVYETLSKQVIRKIKRRCSAPEWPAVGLDSVQARRLTRYSLSDSLDALDELHAEELLEMGALKARVWLRARRALPAPAGAARAASLAAALAALPAALAPAPLAAPPPAASGVSLLRWLVLVGADDELAEALRAARAARGAGAGAGGDARGARAALRLLRALRRAPAAPVAALLHDLAEPDLLETLCEALGLVGSAATHAAVAPFLRLRSPDVTPHLARRYLAALALAPRPQESVIEDVLRAAEEVNDASIVESALLAAGAAASRLPAEPVAGVVRDALARSLANCKDDECRRVRIHALGNLQREDTIESLLEHAERGAGPAALAALDALEGVAAALATPERVLRLERLVLDARALEVRAAALDLLLRCSAVAPFSLPRTLLALHERAPSELQRLAWQRLRALAVDHEHVRKLIRMLPLRLRGWDAQAMAGTSSVLVREAAADGGWRALLESVQLARGGLLRRGRVRLLTLSPANVTDDTLSVEIWTRGLEAFAGDSTKESSSEDEGEAEATSGGLALGVGGLRAHTYTLFSGQAELLGHVWAGTGSEPTPVLRALRPAGGAEVALPLLGGAALTYRYEALVSLALDAQAQVSLWSRSARSQLELRGAAVAEGEARVETAWGALTAEAADEAEPSMTISADLDFYDGVELCVRADVAAHARGAAVALRSALGARRERRVRRRAARRGAAPGRTLALGARNDAACRALGPGA
ncbi:microsomal triacylglycerol transfer protein [Nymphalis io]|uniref:microsomal triacylglycerol transfer protein n=1 Tax=Inachis io TaxID=171585 RepID=UPI00216A202B|nr:microsomal triacylglycerol transfer protein [Nymphalis io]